MAHLGDAPALFLVARAWQSAIKRGPLHSRLLFYLQKCSVGSHIPAQACRDQGTPTPIRVAVS